MGRIRSSIGHLVARELAGRHSYTLPVSVLSIEGTLASKVDWVPQKLLILADEAAFRNTSP